MPVRTRRLGYAAAAFLTLACAMPALADPLAAMLAAERARPVAPRFPRDAFVSEPLITSVTLAPDGSGVAFLRITGGQYSLWLQPSAAGAPARRLLQRTDAREIAWSRDSRWLVMIAPDKVQMLSPAGDPGSGIAATLGGATELRLLGLNPWHPGVLLVDRAGARWRLWHAGPGGARRLLAHSAREIVDAAIGRDGRAAFVKLVDGERHLIVARSPKGGFHGITACVAMERCDLLGVTPDNASVYVSGDLLGERRALLRLDADGKRTLIHADPASEVDIDGIVLDRMRGVPQIASYRGTRPARYGLLPGTAAILARLSLAPDAMVETSSATWLVRERDARLQGNRWYLLDPASGAMRLLLDDRVKRLPPDALARVTAFTWPASDGMTIHGLLSVPSGLDPAHVPLVTIVHGGPWSHDDTDYSALTQLLVNRGYAVFRPQFRGSTGYGRAYMFAAQGDYGDGRVQRDIEEGTRYLLARGVGDRTRTAIMGASFGGYSTLQALSNGSRLYRAGIAIVPPPDFGWTSRWAAIHGNLGRTQGMALDRSLRLLALNPDDRAIAERLHRQSPLARVAAMRTPLLLIASGRDERVPIRSVIDYAAHLKLLGAPAGIIIARNQPHAPSDPMAMRAYLFLAESMFQRHLGGIAPAAPSNDLRAWMVKSLVER
ncbi:dipeptidyl aminopeptidase/acylaminoacyl peptidase [Sphingomonas kyeonggiensis]|uniref:Dipeptidyl aminopeptidase/acylaminoacyl peptidase n=1 Tax=Sphingomonas kyeonggiensis TaxID=1268553 RepID=A0A7W7NTV5_9SPHN|nr:prolyl oligopeptidase family serine peptidase [Sphingomonas kyeonggiensis]MBB4840377.1 dipeptidyl aminopeptidase/acylaminoacyl peptidase [Sphingomonas kyeonggiensis]